MLSVSGLRWADGEGMCIWEIGILWGWYVLGRLCYSGRYLQEGRYIAGGVVLSPIYV